MKHIIKAARQLRRKQTDVERLLWVKLRNRQIHGLKFRRQHPVPPYVVDFFCEEAGLVIELDGGQHNEERDAKRTAFLEAEGYRVLRFWNHDILENMEGVLMRINACACGVPSPSRCAGPSLSPWEREV